MTIVEPEWLARPSTEVAPALIGCALVRQLPDGQRILARIVETEAYQPGDPASHASRGRTPRNQAMFGLPGTIYVYLIYGMYHCLNIVCDRPGVASAVLIRALQLDVMPPGIQKIEKLSRIAAGPGKLCRTLQIDRSLNDRPLQLGGPLWLEHRTPEFQQQLDQGTLSLVQTTRIGISLGTDLLWRWYLANSPSVSKF
ncbi:DNA-3-methyladenine glycosylase [Laspinema olomoucense]|uniref:Putative 3-methyladenine DNA glycosylase n=1 Tax=Laspinema olomoucense D3b TaxID=2953688 RepID=A0ABT2NAK0_9CYAN|nr:MULTISPECIES: DNA-3-methyladenine glycosylase [unclassified Laspinema]MCT7979735.1 DNA-3-methyladenine glycosylase [Laspinema sp. D3b]MCT7991778.1 DNA-3-methyladenine glycosylase [Laspinema sp. D3a]